MGKPRQVVAELIAGKLPITVETATRLEEATGVPSGVWVRLEAAYRKSTRRMKRPEKICRGERPGIGERSSALPAGCFAARSARWARTPLGSAPIEAGVHDVDGGDSGQQPRGCF